MRAQEIFDSADESITVSLLLEKPIMLWTIFVILLVLWLFGLVSSYTLGGYIHLLLIIAVVVLLIRLIQGRPAP
jgi:hypothetical protein